MAKKGERRPWRIRYEWVSSDIKGTETRSSKDDAERFAADLFENAKQRDSEIRVTIENRDTGESYEMSAPTLAQPETYRHGKAADGTEAHDLVSPNESAALCGTVADVFLHAEEADKLPWCSRCDAISAAELEETPVAKPSAAELKNDAENMLFALEGADSEEKINGLEASAQETLLKIAAGPRVQLSMRLKEAVAKAKERLAAESKAPVAPVDYTAIENADALTATAVEKIKQGVEFGLKATNVADEIAELSLMACLTVPYRGLPDIKKASGPSRSFAAHMFEVALEGVEGEDAKAAHRSLKDGVNNRSRDVLVKYLRALNDDASAESFAETFPMIDVDEGETREEAVRDAYAQLGMNFPTLTRAEEYRERRAAAKEMEGKPAPAAIESGEAGKFVADTMADMGQRARTITPKMVKTLSDSEKADARKAVMEAMKDMTALLAELS